MRLKTVACTFANGLLIAMSVFAPDAKPGKASQTAPVTQARQPKRYRVGEDAQRSRLVHAVSPLYPPALGKRMDGTVVLHVIIGANGSVQSARPVSGPSNLRDSAVNAVLQWKYKQTFMNDEPVEVDTTVSVVFPPPAKEEPPATKN